jgi:hypothetical protein
MSFIFFIISILILWKSDGAGQIIGYPMFFFSLIAMAIRIKESIDFDNRMENLEKTNKIHNDNFNARLEELTTRPCPMCAETIKNDARKCKHCGEMVDPVVKEVQPAVIAENNEVIEAQDNVIPTNINAEQTEKNTEPEEAVKTLESAWYYLPVILVLVALVRYFFK